MNSIDGTSAADPSAAEIDTSVAAASDEFLVRHLRGENPDVEQFADGYPDIAHILRGILPALRMMNDSGFHKRPETQAAAGLESIEGTLGDYRLIREIGRGGMGVVYEAEQISLNRRVALKTLPFAAALDTIRLERFKNEAQAAAQLHHASIVPVYAVGCERGVWYYAMQMIDGATLAESIDQLKESQARPFLRVDGLAETIIDPPDSSDGEPNANSAGDGGPMQQQPPSKPLAPATAAGRMEATPIDAAMKITRYPLSTTGSNRDRGFFRSIVNLGIQAAEALDHAHSLDVIHRDVKPGNLIVDARGHLWVADFGLARFRDDAHLTATGDMLGTLAYMSPEQVSGHRGSIDHRTDIYSLGATLYELLTLQPPYTDSNKAALVHQIASQDPPAIRRLNPSIPMDLETIVMKAMAREPESRYDSIGEMADDLRRFLDSRPITARRPGLLERISKWTRRHRSVVAVACGFLLLLCAALVASTVLIAREQTRTHNALVALQQRQVVTSQALASEAAQRELATKNLAMAENNFREAREVLEFYITIADQDLARHDELQDARSAMLQVGLEYYQGFIEKAQNDKPLQAELAASHQRVARILHTIGSTCAAESALESALQTQERLVQDNPNDEGLRRQLFAMYFQLGAFNGAEPIHLVQQASIQQHLSLSPEQSERAETLGEVFCEFHPFIEGSSNDFTASRRQFRHRTADTLDSIETLLDDDQFRRLREIDLQRRGPGAWSDPEIASVLGLTAMQRIRIREIREDMRRRCGERRREGLCAELKRFQAELVAVLTTEQAANWARMQGEPFRGRVARWQSGSRS